MAGFTLFAKASFMVVITPVAVDTFPFQFFLEIVVLVTGVAFGLIMGATKRKLGFVVVELGFRPAGGAMAFVAFFPKPPRMNVVHRMAVNAFFRRSFVSLIGVTTVARDLLMLSR
jgi:hypothetical protein